MVALEHRGRGGPHGSWDKWNRPTPPLELICLQRSTKFQEQPPRTSVDPSGWPTCRVPDNGDSPSAREPPEKAKVFLEKAALWRSTNAHWAGAQGVPGGAARIAASFAHIADAD